MNSNTSKEEVTKKICKLIDDRLEITCDESRINDDLVEDLGFDDLDLVETVMDCEDEFNISITEEEAEKIKTLGGLIDVCWNIIQKNNA